MSTLYPKRRLFHTQCGSVTISSTDLHFGLPEESPRRYEERTTFLRKHDGRNRRLSFLYNENDSKCGCTGGSEFFFADEHGAKFFNETLALCNDDKQSTFNKCAFVLWQIGKKAFRSIVYADRPTLVVTPGFIETVLKARKTPKLSKRQLSMSPLGSAKVRRKRKPYEKDFDRTISTLMEALRCRNPLALFLQRSAIH